MRALFESGYYSRAGTNNARTVPFLFNYRNVPLKKSFISVILTPEVNKRKISDTSQPWVQDGKEELKIAIEIDAG